MCLPYLSPLVAQTAEIARLERAVETDPDDVASRLRLLHAYVVNPDNQRRAGHLLWLIEHHPETPAIPTSNLVFADPGPLQDAATYERVAELWLRQAASHPNDPQVISNAARFLRAYYYLTDPFQSEQWTLKAWRIAPENPEWREQLAMDYAFALVHAVSGTATPRSVDFAIHVREELGRSTDGALLWKSGDRLVRVARSPAIPAMLALQDYGRQLMQQNEPRRGAASNAPAPGPLKK